MDVWLYPHHRFWLIVTFLSPFFRKMCQPKNRWFPALTEDLEFKVISLSGFVSWIELADPVQALAWKCSLAPC
jgi:hypothetical protein